MNNSNIEDDNQILFVTVREYKYLLKCESFFNLIQNYFSPNEIKQMLKEKKGETK